VAILQALISLISRSASTALNAIFGWAVLALFGQTSPKEKTLLSALVGAAGAWPLLLVGIAFPKIALFAISFVPLAKTMPTLWLRLVWIGLALIVPIVVGIVVASRSPPQNLPEPKWKKLLRGFPITLALAGAFLMMLVVAPIQKIAAMMKGKEVVHLPAVMRNKLLAPEIMGALAGSLGAHGIRLQEAAPPWTMTAPSKILLKIGGQAFAHMVTEHIEFRKNDRLEVAVMPNEAVLKGKPDEVARARALAMEVYAPREVSETFSPAAQLLEKQIKRVWSVYLEEPRRHRSSPALVGRVNEIATELAETNLPPDEWQVVYRLLLQLDRALRGDRPLLTRPPAHPEEGAAMAERKIYASGPPAPVALPSPRTMSKDVPTPPITVAVPVSVEGLSTRELVGHITESAVLLAKKEIELARTEIKADLKAELGMVKGMGVAGVCALLTACMLLVSLTLGLGNFMAEWLAGLLVSALVLTVGTVAGVVGWGKRVKNPLEATRRTLKEDAQWAKERLA
jgi:hypothetical protein